MTAKLRAPVFFMALTILVITLFQAYWLRQHFREEKHVFSVRTNVLFRETIMRLQASKLHIDSNIHIRVQEKEGIIETTDLLQEQIKDTLQRKGARTMTVLDLHQPENSPQRDSNTRYQVRSSRLGAPVFDFLMRIDSLRDSISVKEITDRYTKALAKAYIDLPFVITSSESPARHAPPLLDLDNNRVEIGFLKPRAYQLDFINTNWYIVKQMWQPVTISFLLIGITIASFLLMYRNLIKQQKLTQQKNNFISNITHELKTPIATVSVAIEALKNFNALQDPLRTSEYLDISGNEMQRLGLLVDKVLKLSLYENKEISLNKESFNLVSMANEVIASMKLQFDRLGASATIETNGENFVIEADRLHLTSVLYNLLDNALKYSKEQPRIKVQVTDHNSYLELSVQDNGIGIAPEYRYKIFEQFFRVPGGDRHNSKGYGLGLSYVNHIVRSHMGFIEVNSRLGEGSVFSVNLPFKESPVVDYGKGRKIRKKVFKIIKA